MSWSKHDYAKAFYIAENYKIFNLKRKDEIKALDKFTDYCEAQMVNLSYKECHHE